MRLQVMGAAMALTLGIGAAAPMLAQERAGEKAADRLSVAVMPTQYFEANSDAAAKLTRALEGQFQKQGYEVLPADRVNGVARSLKLDAKRHYPDATAVKFGRQAGVDLVAYPRLLGQGKPLSKAGDNNDDDRAAVIVHLRVLNVATGKPIFFRQIEHPFGSPADVETTPRNQLHISQAEANAAAEHVMRLYFERVAGSREEIHTGNP